MSERASSMPGDALTRVRYPETDKMGVAHHSHYLVWFELGRTEWMRQRGVPYAEVEEKERMFLPVVELGAVYRAPARYDDVLRIRTRVGWVGRVRVRLEYSVVREQDGVVLAEGFTVHASVDERGAVRRLPASLLERFSDAPQGPA